MESRERREVSRCRYKSSGPKRCPSPSLSPKRCVSAERKRPTTTAAAGNESSTMSFRAPSPKLGNNSADCLRPTKTLDDHKMKISSRPKMVIVAPSARRLSLDGTTSKPLQHKSASDLLMLISRDEMSGIEGLRGSSVDDRCSLWTQRPAGSRPASPSRSRGLSPSRHITPPILSFNADIKKWKKDASNAEDVHQLRLLHNRYMQWQFANAQADAAMHSQKKKAQRMFYSVWRRIVADMLVSAREKRCYIQQLKFKLKLYSILQSQVSFVDEWSSMERDHNKSLKWAIQDLQDNTLRIPVTGGARGDIKSVEEAVGCVIDVMSSMESSLCSIQSQMEGMNCMVLELADLATHQRYMLDECESLLGSTHQLQVEEYSLRTHLLQMIQACKNGCNLSTFNGY